MRRSLIGQLTIAFMLADMPGLCVSVSRFQWSVSTGRLTPNFPWHPGRRRKWGYCYISVSSFAHTASSRGLASRSKSILRKVGSAKDIVDRHKKCSTVQWASSTRFEIGDEVITDWHDDSDNSSYLSGVIEARGGGGWYTVCLSNAIRVKRRVTQLQKKNSDLDAVTTENAVVQSYTQVQPSLRIIDLDSILLNSRQSPSDGSPRGILSKSQYESTLVGYVEEEVIQQIISCHSTYNRWVVFSDLHVMPSTLSTCLQVLEFVHRTAIARQAGIIFLGDFWHHRGFVRVDCLNAVLEAMSHWRVPCIMIPGNHDQINWGGTEHALTPLKNAYRITCSNLKDPNETAIQYPGPLILSHPTKFMNAFFVPHTRDKTAMRAILRSNEAANSGALFVHADVKGASMNDLIKSQHGISASHFPPDRYIYSGHFHKPHVVSANGESSSIRYVGSPYQVSLSEAGQSKYLLLLDSEQGWDCLEEIAVDIGPRYHRVSSISSFLCSSELHLRSGDKMSVIVPQQELDELRANIPDSSLSSFDAKIKELRDAHVTVEIRNFQSEPMETSPTHGGGPLEVDEQPLELEELSPRATLEAYLKNEVNAGALGKDTANKVLNDGHAILNELNEETSQKNVESSPTKSPVSIEFDSVSLVGFGSFRKEFNYPLNKRGVVLLRGTNKDFGSDSNGVGKSTLAMASLWALVGSIDPRPVQDGKVVDVVNDFSKNAAVTLRGTLNSKPFLVKRTKNLSSGSSLCFVLDGSDLTLQSTTDTQKLINEHFARESNILIRTIFHGQHSIGSLLESSDTKLKEELSCLISLDIWQRAASLVRSKQRDLQRKLSELDGMLLIRTKDAERASDKLKSSEDEMNKRKIAIEHERSLLMERAKALSNVETPNLDDNMTLLQTKIKQFNSEINELENELYNFTSADNEKLMNLRSQLEKSRSQQTQVDNSLRDSLRHFDAKRRELTSLENQLTTFKTELNLSTLNHTLAEVAITCHSCGQPITSKKTRDFLRQSLVEKIGVVTSQIQEAQKDLAAAERTKLRAQEDSKTIADTISSHTNVLQKEEDSLSLRTKRLRDKLQEARLLQSTHSSEYTRLVRQSQALSQSKVVQSNIQSDLNRLHDALTSAVDFYDSCCSDLESIDKNIVDIRNNKDALTKQASSYGSLIEVFGTKGIQTFILRNIVKALEYYSQSYLDELSDGSLQLLLRVGSNDNIIKQAKIQNPDGTWRTRSLSSLSGGQWRRCSLSLSLGFMDLASHRGKLRSSLLVLDEPLTHLDSAGRSSVGKLLRKMLDKSNEPESALRRLGGLGLSTILVILQDIAAEEIEECFDYIDEVTKCDGESYVHVALDQSMSK
ncbi:hypothetical protein HJC23_005528 [Cyclotella cryptica]|uniref:Calcineurin-like phosphoesterase domain-containing protein n=1 Tax=Cyclotella cryptica TaxID=29204 RepID=A0ABD3PXB5_9STRA|eukprot:CCRYP_010608-RA/>CCRYP_010608-RA protein AED:0.02 eAED:0.02 QI:105/1/1/1/0.5/0.4/5/2652/1345